MEEQIKEAKRTLSISSVVCKIFSIVGVIGSFYYLINISSKGFNKDPYFWGIFGASLSTCVSVGALGSIADSSKKNKALTALLVESTNSASQLPISKEIEYSDLNEDN